MNETHADPQQQNEVDDVLATLGASEGAPATAKPKPDSTDGLLDELAALESELDGKPFDDLADLFSAEHAEKIGRAFEWPAMPGATVTIAHISAAVDKKAELEDQYRKRKAKLPGERLVARVEERLWEEAMLGTVVKGWSGLKRDGYEYPFTAANYRALMRVRRFRAFVLEKARDADAFRAQVDAEIAGN